MTIGAEVRAETSSPVAGSSWYVLHNYAWHGDDG